MNKFVASLKLLLIPEENKEFALFIYNTTGIFPKNLAYYHQCFVHRSSSTKTKIFGNNERLEFLGDAILDSVVADYLYSEYPKEKEGILSELRARIVNRQNLNKIGVEMHLEKRLNARIPNLKRNDAIGNCLEAFIGAIYKDQGYRKTKEFILKKIILPHCKDKAQINNTNYKSILLQYCQQNKITLQFETEEISDTKMPSFKSRIVMDEQIVCESMGKSKKEAEQTAAKQAIRIKQIQTRNYNIA